MSRGTLRAGDARREWAADAAAFVGAAGGCLAVPALLHGLVHVRSWAVYRLMWLNFVGHHYRMPIDTPKPLLVFRAGLFGETGYFVVGVLLFALLAVAFRRVAKALSGRGWPGLVAFALVFLGNRYVLPGPFLIAYWPVVYYTLVAAAGWLFLEGRWNWAFAVVGVSGLVRPESWALAAAMLAIAAWRDAGRLRWAHALALAAAPLWMGFDWVLSGDPLYSFHTLQRYRAHLGASATPPGLYWSKVVSDATRMFHDGLLATGALGMVAGLVGARTEREIRGHLYFLAVVLIPALGYWAASWVTDVILHIRFFSPALVVLYLYAALLPLLLARPAAVSGAGGRARGVRGDRPPAPRAAGDAGSAGPAPGRGAALVAGVWAVVCLFLGLRTDAWEKARDVSSDRARNDRARREAVQVLRRSWVDGGGSLLAGRSIEYLGLRLGEEASRRMHQYRMVAGDDTSLRELAPGYAVWIRGDVGGLGYEYRFLQRYRAQRERGVRFRPVTRLVDEEGRILGVVHEFTRVEGDGEGGGGPGGGGPVPGTPETPTGGGGDAG